MRFGSVCSGIEAASVAWGPLGWEAAWFSEIEPFPCGVLAHHYPTTPNHGDMTKLPARIRVGEVEAPDLLCGGTPCQAFSVAGLRRSLDDDRGNLTLTFVEIADAIDAVRSGRGDKPAIIVWENVPGVRNTDDNAFGCFLAGLAGETVPLEPAGKRWTDAGVVLGPARTVVWRVLDAQYFGLAQRRRRVFVAASARDDIDCASVLFERDGVRRDSAPSREEGQGVASPLRTRAPGFGGHQNDYENIAICLNAHTGITQPDFQTYVTEENTYANDSGGVGFSAYAASSIANYSEGVGCLRAAGGDLGGGSEMLIVGQKVSDTTDLVATYDSRQHHNPQPSDTAQLTTKNCAFVRGDSPLVAFSLNKTAVRRLTPRECERLQGFPDDYTAIPWRNKLASDCPDGPRYKALGNSWAVPVVRWIGNRIQQSTR